MSLAPGTIVRRTGGEKNQQGGYVQIDEEGNMILMNVIDLKKGELIANEGVLRPDEGDHITCVALMDAGSDHLGRGVKTALATAKKITKALEGLYPDFEYTPLAGRDAFGKEQSFQEVFVWLS